MSSLVVRNIELDDAGALCAIYNHYIEHTTVAFEEKPLEPQTGRPSFLFSIC